VADVVALPTGVPPAVGKTLTHMPPRSSGGDDWSVTVPVMLGAVFVETAWA
jgi:hypothetical protein